MERYAALLGLLVVAAATRLLACSNTSPSGVADAGSTDAAVPTLPCTIAVPGVRSELRGCPGERLMVASGNIGGTFVSAQIDYECSSVSEHRVPDSTLLVSSHGGCPNEASVLSFVDIVDTPGAVGIGFSEIDGRIELRARCLRSRYERPEVLVGLDEVVVKTTGCSSVCDGLAAVYIRSDRSGFEPFCVETLAEDLVDTVYVEVVASRAHPPSYLVAEYPSLADPPRLAMYDAVADHGLIRVGEIHEALESILLPPGIQGYLAWLTASEELVLKSPRAGQFEVVSRVKLPGVDSLVDATHIDIGHLAVGVRLTQSAFEHVGLTQAWIVLDSDLEVLKLVERRLDAKLLFKRDDDRYIIARTGVCDVESTRWCATLEPATAVGRLLPD